MSLSGTALVLVYFGKNTKIKHAQKIPSNPLLGDS
jgi:hypothetical protein